MTKPLKILSIDWDYFIEADINQRYLLFPDTPSENYSEKIQEIIWSSRYTEPKLNKIPIDMTALKKLENFLQNFPNEIYLAETHTFCYYLIKLKKENNQKLFLRNIDHHHDMYYQNNNNKIQCGNWLYKTIQENPKGDYLWIKNPDSEMFNTNKLTKKLKTTTELDKTLSEEYDIVFFCQSAMWSPPHLDHYYLEIFNKIRYKTITLEPKIWKNRYQPFDTERTKRQCPQLTSYAPTVHKYLSNNV